MTKSDRSNDSDSSSSSGSSHSRDHKRRKVSESASEKKEKQQPIIIPSIICVRNLSRNVNKNHLIEIFGNFGKIKKVDIPIDEKTHKRKDFAYIEYETKNECEEAVVYMNEGQIDGKVLKIEFMNIDPTARLKEKKGRKSKSPTKKPPTHVSHKPHVRSRHPKKPEDNSGENKRKRSRSRSNHRRNRVRSRSRNNRNRGRRIRTRSRSHSKERDNNMKRGIGKEKAVQKKEESSSRSSSKSSSSLDDSSSGSSSSSINNKSKSKSKK